MIPPAEADRPAPLPRPEVLETGPAHHGALDYGELEALNVDPEGVLDFSVNSNPYGPSPAVREALRSVPLDRYPDRECLALRRALAAHLGVRLDQIVAGNGTAELLWLTAAAFLRPAASPQPITTGDQIGGPARDRVVILGPTFGEYRRASQLMGAEVCEYAASSLDGFRPNREVIAELLARMRPRLVFLCHPNNPTGAAYDLDIVGEWARAHPDALFVVDEAYLAFAPRLASTIALGAPNILALRSMTKDYALAGLRLGYAVGTPSVVEALARVRPAWNVNALAQAAGIAALREQAYLQRTLGELARAKGALTAGLRGLGLSPLPSEVHFFLVDVGDGRAFRGALLQRGIQVRDCASFGLPAYVRIAARRPPENDRLLAAVATLCG